MQQLQLAHCFPDAIVKFYHLVSHYILLPSTTVYTVYSAKCPSYITLSITSLANP